MQETLIKSLPHERKQEAPRLKRDLKLFDATALVIGCIIGAGIFRVASPVAGVLSYPGLVLAAWVIGGLISMAGALCYAELGAAFPKSGGDYVYLTKSYGRLTGFLFGWTKLFIERTGTIAILGFVFSEYLGFFTQYGPAGSKTAASLAILALTACNIVGIHTAKNVQNFFSSLKVLALAAIILAGAIFWGKSGAGVNLAHWFPETINGSSWMGIGMALVFILWTYGGWTESVYVAEEIENPARDLPRSIILGLALVTALYLAVNLMYMAYVPLAEMAGKKLAAAEMMTRAIGGWGAAAISAVVILSTFGALNGYILTSSRILFAIGREHKLFTELGKINVRTSTPVRALLFNAAWAVALVWTGTLDSIVTYSTVVISIFYAMTGLSVFILRAKFPDAPRPFKVWGYPFTPLVFTAAMIAFIASVWIGSPRDTGWGFLLLAAGVPLYAVSNKLTLKSKMPAFAGMTHKSTCHSGEGRNPGSLSQNMAWLRHWIPAFAGMTVVLLGSVAAFFLFRPAPMTPAEKFLAPHVTEAMQKADFWIAQIPDATIPILSSEELRAWNQIASGESNSIIPDLSQFRAFSNRATLTKVLEEDLRGPRENKLFTRNKMLLAEEEIKKLSDMQNKNSIPLEISPRYGIVVNDTSLRALPTSEPLTEKPGDLEFDELQNTRARAFTSVLVLHTSTDGGWFYVQSPDMHGWVGVSHVALIPNERGLKSLSDPERFLTVLSDRLIVYSDPECATPFTELRMGTRITLISAADSRTSPFKVLIPIRGSGGLVDVIPAYVKKSDDVCLGFLPYTREHVLRQAFKLLGTPYGWGGLWNGRDCSSFIQDVFATMGVCLPRNSKNQAEAGNLLIEFSEKASNSEKEPALNETPAGISLLRLKGHIMLYLGKFEGRHYVIHNSSGYNTGGLFRDTPHKLNRVVVSDLGLSKGSRKKSLEERLLSIHVIS
ncbi:MAG: SH3 domain-containing protein [Candidatus Omnitrophica bacterium]|nr:SH3 domain-containing protein [Candidatus Omnitrophota bacterium]